MLVPQMEFLQLLIPPFRVPTVVTSIAIICIFMENIYKGLLKSWIPICPLFYYINNGNFRASIIENLQENMKKH
jgi:hypothetical protein